MLRLNSLADPSRHVSEPGGSAEWESSMVVGAVVSSGGGEEAAWGAEDSGNAKPGF